MLSQVVVLIIVFLKDLWADYHPAPQREGTMTQGRAENNPPAERPSTPRSRADDVSRVKAGVQRAGSKYLPSLFQAKKE